jgi:hypothetical protein
VVFGQVVAGPSKRYEYNRVFFSVVGRLAAVYPFSEQKMADRLP